MNGVAQVRRFNRAVGGRIGVLRQDFLGLSRPYAASRMLFEIGESGLEVRALRARLGLDSGYASRLLRLLEKEELITVGSSETDARVRFVRLTLKGQEELATLNRLSDELALSILEPLSEKQRAKLLEAMDTVERLLRASAVVIEVEDASSAVAQQCLTNYYLELAERFEEGFDPSPAGGNAISADEMSLPMGQLLVAWLHGTPVGCGAIRFYPDYGEIKRMWIAPEMRGLGLSKRILATLEGLACAQGLPRVRLDTNRALLEAHALYRSSGYHEIGRFNDNPYAHLWFEKELI